MSIAGLIATRPGTPHARPRLIYRLRTHRGRKGERRGFTEVDSAALFDAMRTVDQLIALVKNGSNGCSTAPSSSPASSPRPTWTFNPRNPSH